MDGWELRRHLMPLCLRMSQRKGPAPVNRVNVSYYPKAPATPVVRVELGGTKGQKLGQHQGGGNTWFAPLPRRAPFSLGHVWRPAQTSTDPLGAYLPLLATMVLLAARPATDAMRRAAGVLMRSVATAAPSATGDAGGTYDVVVVGGGMVGAALVSLLGGFLRSGPPRASVSGATPSPVCAHVRHTQEEQQGRLAPP